MTDAQTEDAYRELFKDHIPDHVTRGLLQNHTWHPLSSWNSGCTSETPRETLKMIETLLEDAQMVESIHDRMEAIRPGHVKEGDRASARSKTQELLRLKTEVEGLHREFVAKGWTT